MTKTKRKQVTYIASTIALTLILFLSLKFVLLEVENKIANQKTNSIEESIKKNLNHGKMSILALSGLVASTDNINQKKLNNLGEIIEPELNDILTIGIAPNGVVSFIYPLSKQNIKIIGHDIPNDEKRKKEYIMAIKGGNITLSWVKELKQNGSGGLILRKPYYKNGAQAGILFVAIKTSDIFKDARLHGFEVKTKNVDLGEITYSKQEIHGEFIKRTIKIENTTMEIFILKTIAISNLTLLAISLAIAILHIKLIALSIKNIRKRKNAIYKDHLTDTYNRRYLEETKDNLCRENFFVIVIDIDHFKSINDNHGHDAGDFILKKFSQLLKENTRKSDIVIRYGGEEFIIIIISNEVESAINTSKRIHRKTKLSSFLFNDTVLKITCSIGISCGIKNALNVDASITEADTNLYKAKRGGRNSIYFDGVKI